MNLTRLFSTYAVPFTQDLGLCAEDFSLLPPFSPSPAAAEIVFFPRLPPPPPVAAAADFPLIGRRVPFSLPPFLTLYYVFNAT
jgi:hypothetical protein